MDKMIVVVIVFIIVIALISFGQIFLKRGMGALGENAFKQKGLFGVVFHPPVLMGIIFYLISAFLWLFLLGRLDVSSVYPLISLSYVITVFLAVTLLGEQVTYTKWLAVGLIVIGSLIMVKG